MPTKHPAIRPHATTLGVWLIPDTDDGNALAAQLPPERPQPIDATTGRPLPTPRVPLAGLIAGIAAFLILPRFGLTPLLSATLAVGIGAIATTAARLHHERRQARLAQLREQLATTALAVQAPQSLLDLGPTEQPRPRQPRRLDWMHALPDVNGVPALTLIWQAGHDDAADAAVKAVTTEIANRTEQQRRAEHDRQARVIQDILHTD